VNTYKFDDIFTGQFVYGVNPIMIEAIPTTNSFPLSQLPEVTADNLRKIHILEGKDPVQELIMGRFSILDYRPSLEPFITKTCDEKYPGYLQAPVALIWHDVENSKLYTLCIKIETKGPVYFLPLPSATVHEKNSWTIAKVNYTIYCS
jgi:hypothetical protein